MKERSIARREFLQWSALGLAGLALSACTPEEPTAAPSKEEEPEQKEEAAAEPTKAEAAEEAPAEKVSLVYQNRAVEEGAVAARQACWGDSFPIFQEEHPNIEVEFRTSPPEHWDKLVASFSAGTAPDIYELCCTNSYKVVETGQALNLQPYIDLYPDALDMDDFYPEQFKPWKNAEGDIHAVPRDSGAQVLYYNVDMFEEEGVDLLPKDYENNIDHQEYDDISLEFVRRETPMRWGTTSYGLGASWTLQYHLWSFGAHMVDPDNKDRCVLDTPEALEAIEWAQAAVWDKNCFAYGGDVGDLGPGPALRGERVAMMEIGPWSLLPQSEGANFRWDVAPLPDGPAGHTGFNSVDCYQGWSGTDYPDATWELLRFLAGAEHTKFYSSYTYRQPCLNSLNEFWMKTVREKEPKLRDVSLEVFGRAREVGHPEAMFTNDGVVKNEILGPAFDRITLQGKEPPEYILPFVELVNRFNAGEVSSEEIGTEVQKLLGS